MISALASGRSKFIGFAGAIVDMEAAGAQLNRSSHATVCKVQGPRGKGVEFVGRGWDFASYFKNRGRYSRDLRAIIS